MKGDYLFGAFSVADPFLFVMLRWAFAFGIGVPEPLIAYFDRIKARPAIARAMAEEGIDCRWCSSLVKHSGVWQEASHSAAPASFSGAVPRRTDMTDLTRREPLAASAPGALGAAMPAWAQDKTMPADTAQWDLTDLYPSDAAWDEARKQALAALPGMKKYQGTLGTSADALVRALVAQSDLGRTDRKSTRLNS